MTEQDWGWAYLKCERCGLVGHYKRPHPQSTYLYLCDCGGTRLSEATQEEYERQRKEKP